MKKYITSLSLAFLMVGCTGTSVSPESKQVLQQSAGYHVNKVDVTIAKSGFLDFSKEQKLYPNGAKLATYFKQDIEKYLKQQGKLCQDKASCVDIDVAINYMRNFNLKSVSVGAPVIDRTITLHKGDKILYSTTQQGLKPHSGGLLGNAMGELAVFTKAGESKPNLADERKDIDIISKLTVDEIVGMGK